MLFFQAIQIAHKPIRGYTKDMTLIYYPEMPEWVNVYPLLNLSVLKCKEHDYFTEVIIDISDKDLKNKIDKIVNNKLNNNETFLNKIKNICLHLFKIEL